MQTAIDRHRQTIQARGLSPSERLIYAIIATVLLSPGYVAFIHLPYILSVHAGCIPLLIAARLRLRQVASFVIGSAVLFVVAVCAVGPVRTPAAFVNLLAIVSGSIALVGLIVMSITGKAERGPWARQCLLAVFGMHAVTLASKLLVAAISESLPMTFDRHLYACDATYGVQVSFLLGRLLETAPPAAGLVLGSLLGLAVRIPPFICQLTLQTQSRMAAAREFRGHRDCRAVLLFRGSCHGTGLSISRTVSLESTRIGDIGNPANSASRWLKERNAITSHGWALVLLWWTRGQHAWLQMTMGLFLAVTVLATLGFGEHYVVDLIVAVPFAALTFALTSSFLPDRSISWASVAVGLGLTAIWLILLRSYITLLMRVHWAVWLLSALTVVIPSWLSWRCGVDGDWKLRVGQLLSRHRRSDVQ